VVDEAAITEILSKIVDPGRGPGPDNDIVSSGQVKSITVNEEGAVSFILEVDPERGHALEPLRAAAEKAVAALAGVTRVQAMMTAHVGAGLASTRQSTGQNPGQKVTLGAEISVPDFKPATTGAKPGLDLQKDGPAFPPPRAQPEKPAKLPGIDRIIAIASGKGGVGKSTVAANLAVALAARGQKVGMLDADVYGPSQPRMLGLSGRPSSPDGNVILPLRNHGVTVMSLGLMIEEDEALVWRGPMLMGALQQMLTQVQWGKLDILLVDLPPGTGDVQMTLCQKTEVAGVIIVSTPQDIALIDARKGIDMFQQLETPILGIVENMASFVCSECNAVHHPFGHGGAAAEAEKLGVPFLGEIPLDIETRIASDDGAPIVAIKPQSEQAKGFWAVADALLAAETPA